MDAPVLILIFFILPEGNNFIGKWKLDSYDNNGSVTKYSNIYITFQENGKCIYENSSGAFEASWKYDESKLNIAYTDNFLENPFGWTYEFKNENNQLELNSKIQELEYKVNLIRI